MTKNTPVDLYILQKHNPECRWGKISQTNKTSIKKATFKNSVLDFWGNEKAVYLKQ